MEKEPVILFRKGIAETSEHDVASKYFNVYDNRTKIPDNSIVLGRYSVLPFYKELEEDLEYKNCTLINSYRQHRYIADISNWYLDFEDITPKTWFELNHVPSNAGPFVLKGETNSKKFNWKTHMFAENKTEASNVYGRLLQDSLIGNQRICIRQYVPLRAFTKDFSGLPITEEYRFFILNGKVVSGAFYWASHEELLQEHKDINPDNVPREFLNDIIDRIGKNSNFFVVDIARTEKPYSTMEKQQEWIVVEFNDAQSSGLSMCDPNILYRNMKMVINEK